MYYVLCLYPNILNKSLYPLYKSLYPVYNPVFYIYPCIPVSLFICILPEWLVYVQIKTVQNIQYYRCIENDIQHRLKLRKTCRETCIKAIQRKLQRKLSILMDKKFENLKKLTISLKNLHNICIEFVKRNLHCAHERSKPFVKVLYRLQTIQRNVLNI